MTKEEYELQREIIQADLKAKHSRNDMHGVADAAMDTRDLDKYWQGYTDGLVDGQIRKQSGCYWQSNDIIGTTVISPPNQVNLSGVATTGYINTK